jgi:hypothetical protein
MMNRKTFNNYIEQADFRGLFITEMGWNRPHGQLQLPVITVDDLDYDIHCIAERNGFQILTCAVSSIPTMTTCRKIDIKLRRQANDYICIYILSDTVHHEWVAPVKANEKRDLVLIEYSTLEQADFLFSKVSGLSFGLDEVTTIMDVRERIQGTFAINSEKITKDFYSGFRKEHTAFAGFISGIDDNIPTKDNKNKQWYTSVMLNRLMFCYFIQKKGFLNNDTDYLRVKLNWVQKEKGEDRFYSSFYRGFLVQLFHDGLNAPKHDREFEHIYGRIPYLNGGMFDNHQLEQEYPDIDISDDAFIRLFDFFDTWQWHLDTRITASGKDINPDVLGYIFEQYINDRAAMGAYYTKEDITEYIGKNCIIPFLLDTTAQSSSRDDFKPQGYVWQTVRESGDRYIYDAVKRGYKPDWQSQIPDYIAEGIDTSRPNLLDRRARWNEKTSDQFALPTEIWRETIERLQRCDDLLRKISGGEVQHINDFITYNLDIRQFAYDLLLNATDHRLIGNFYHVLQSISILDPTCGSGAFLFAAMNILEPLYEVCISRMQEFNEQNPMLFKNELGEIAHKYRSNIQYFIFKSIILRNLYGVDIMVEATEIAKLRLFLKMVAVVEVDNHADNLGLDPLPDVDFNIRCGNTLVGYANEEELNRDLTFGDIFANQEFKAKIETKMDIVAHTYEVFKDVQLSQTEDRANYKEAKQELTARLAELDELLNKRLFKATGDTSKPYNDWLSSTQPFHWLAEFYQIIHGNGGFDVVIGNPPYIEYNKKDPKTKKAVSDNYKLYNYKTLDCGNLYAFVMERCKMLISDISYIGMIVPLSGHSTERMSPLVMNFYKKFSLRLHLNLSADAHPQKLFEGVKFRLSIFFVSNAHSGCFSTKYTRWYAEERKNLFTSEIRYNDVSNYNYKNVIGKIANPLFISIIKKVMSQELFFTGTGIHKCLYHNAPVNWIRSHSFVPYFCSERSGEGITTQLKSISFNSEDKVKIGSSILNSSLFFIWWITNSDCYHLNIPEISNFKYTFRNDQRLIKLSDKLASDMKNKSCRRIYNYAASGRVEYDEFYMKLSKPIIDEIDKVLAKHYGFTEEELDFIINYDIKYRMGDELNEEQEQ